MPRKAIDQQEAIMENGMESLIEYSINLEDQERPPVLPIGEYIGEIVGVELKYGKESGRPYFNVKFTIPPDNQPADFVEALGNQAPVSLFSMVFGAEDNPVSRFNMKQFCEAARVPLSSRFVASDFLNKEVRIQVKHGQDLSGNPRPEVQRVTKA